MEIGVVCIFVLLIYAYYKVEPPQTKKQLGQRGENMVCEVLGDLDDSYEVKYDVRVGHTQIDHMVICGKTIFVVETKRWGGKVTGRKNDEMWYQEVGGKGYPMRNPILQNEMHIRELKKRYVGYEFINVVVFVGTRSFPRLKGVICCDDLYDYIVEYKKASQRWEVFF